MVFKLIENNVLKISQFICVRSKITEDLRHQYLTTIVHPIPELKLGFLARELLIRISRGFGGYVQYLQKQDKMFLQNFPLFFLPCPSKFVIHKSVSLCH